MPLLYILTNSTKKYIANESILIEHLIYFLANSTETNFNPVSDPASPNINYSVCKKKQHNTQPIKNRFVIRNCVYFAKKYILGFLLAELNKF